MILGSYNCVVEKNSLHGDKSFLCESSDKNNAIILIDMQ